MPTILLPAGSAAATLRSAASAAVVQAGVLFRENPLAAFAVSGKIGPAGGDDAPGQVDRQRADPARPGVETNCQEAIRIHDARLHDIRLSCRPGTGPFFGEKGRLVHRLGAENMDLSPFVAPMVTAHAAGGAKGDSPIFAAT